MEVGEVDVTQPRVIKLWDKDYNLLWSGEKFPEFITVDHDDGSRFSGPVTFQGETP